MKTFDEIITARRAWRNSVTTLLSMGGLATEVPATERGWVRFGVNQRLRDQGVGKPLPWPETPPVDWSADEVMDAIGRAAGTR